MINIHNISDIRGIGYIMHGLIYPYNMFCSVVTCHKTIPARTVGNVF